MQAFVWYQASIKAFDFARILEWNTKRCTIAICILAPNLFHPGHSPTIFLWKFWQPEMQPDLFKPFCTLCERQDLRSIVLWWAMEDSNKWKLHDFVTHNSFLVRYRFFFYSKKAENYSAGNLALGILLFEEKTWTMG